jgi:DNA polymerase III subunit delta
MKNSITFEQILQDLQRKIYKPIYLLHGEESYYIDEITNYISQNVLAESEKAFNQTILYGKDSNVRNIDNIARRFPMAANHQVVIVKEAQTIRDIDKLGFYAENPLKSTILVINYKYKKYDARTKFANTVKKNGVFFESQKIKDYLMPGWISTYLSKKNLKIRPETSQLLTEYLGNDLGKVINEIDKLIITLPEGVNEISPGHIEKNIGISKDYNNFELQKALGEKNNLKVYRIVNYFSQNPKNFSLNYTMISLFTYFKKIFLYNFVADKSAKNVASVLKLGNPYFVREYEAAARKYSKVKLVKIFSTLRQYEMKLKGVDNLSPKHGELLREMVFKILH